MAENKIHLEPRTAGFHMTQRGLLCTVKRKHDAGDGSTVHRFYIPKVSKTKVTTLGKTAVVYIGSGLVLSMPRTMWTAYEDGILTAALGRDWNA